MKPLVVLIGFALPSLVIACGGSSNDVEPSDSPGTSASADTGAPTASCSTSGPGLRIRLEVDVSALTQGSDVNAAVEGDRDIIRKRVEDALACDAEISREGATGLSVVIPGTALDRAIGLVANTGRLEFREPILNDQRKIVCVAAEGSEFAVEVNQVKDGNCIGTGGASGKVTWKPATATDSAGHAVVLTGNFLRPNVTVKVTREQPEVELAFTDEGATLFRDITTRLVGFPLAIVLDNELISSPSVRTAITDGRGAITGFSLDEAKTLTIQLNSGALPVPLRVVSTEEVQP
jgi:preprotein translocase subunit SecD